MKVGIECLLMHRVDALESLSEELYCFLVSKTMLCLVDNCPEDLDPHLEEVLLVVLAVLLRDQDIEKVNNETTKLLVSILNLFIIGPICLFSLLLYHFHVHLKYL